MVSLRSILLSCVVLILFAFVDNVESLTCFECNVKNCEKPKGCTGKKSSLTE